MQNVRLTPQLRALTLLSTPAVASSRPPGDRRAAVAVALTGVDSGAACSGGACVARNVNST